MKIEMAVPQSQNIPQLGRRRQENQEPEISKPLPSRPAGTAEASPAPIPPPEGEVKNSESGQGVIRLLQEGHFKGVADVRLRINFAAELAEIEQSRIKQDADGAIDGVFESVSSVLGSPEVTEPPPEASLDAFEQAVKQSKAAFFAAEFPSLKTLTSDLESAFEAFISSLTPEAQTSSDTEPPSAVGAVGEGNDVIDTETIPGSPGEQDVSAPAAPDSGAAPFDLGAALRTAFSEAMEDLSNKLSTSNILPELSEPNGNGVAYEKFLAIYNNLQARHCYVETLKLEKH